MKRTETIDKLNRQLRIWDGEIARLERKMEKVTNDIYQRVVELKEKKESARKMTESMVSSSEEAWKELKKGAENAFSDVKKALKRAKSKFK